LLSIKSQTDYSACRWTLDTAKDLDFLQAVFLRFGGSNNFGWLEVVNLLEQEPSLSNINQHIRQKALHEG
jgi:spore coat polysaccharide biosynthesis protein SpsF